MFEYIKGKIVEASPLKVVIESSGIGYALFIPLNAYPKIPTPGSDAVFYVSEVIREDAHLLYGFLTRLDRDLFEKLTQVSGIGPKSALALLGHLEFDLFQRAVAESNITLICKVPGIGKKTAERLIIEMRDKLKNLNSTHSSSSLPSTSSTISDALSALIHLGYNQIQAQKALKAALDNAKTEPPLPELIGAALRYL